MTKSKKKPTKQLSVPHKRTEEEVSYMKDFDARRAAKRKIPRINLEFDKGDNKKVYLDYVHNDPEVARALLCDALGTTNEYFFDGLTNQLINAGGRGLKDFDFMLSVVAGIEPKDQMEAMLAAQMGAVHIATMTFARRLAFVDNINQQNSAERAFNKLARTFTTQMEALNRYRGKGQQKMTVEHVHVHEGGQAIVGNVQGGGVNKKQESNPMQKLPIHLSPRCGAKTRRRTLCQSPAMANGRCRMHGGKSPGAPCGPANGNYRHGQYTKKAQADKQYVRELIQEANKLMEMLD